VRLPPLVVAMLGPGSGGDPLPALAGALLAAGYCAGDVARERRTGPQTADAFNRHDREAMVALCDPKCEWLPALEAEVEGEPVVYLGHDGLRQYFKDVAGVFEEYRFDVSECRDLGTRVLLLGRLSTRGRGSGVELASDLAALSEWRDGKCVRVVAYRDHAEALEAVGLSEEQAHADS
jgi:ketosteroid isomerase-like protein